MDGVEHGRRAEVWADAIFGFIAAVNSYIGIRQELKAKETLEMKGSFVYRVIVEDAKVAKKLD